MQVLSGAVEPIPEHYSFELNQLARKLLTADPAQRPSIDEVLALPVVGDWYPIITLRKAWFFV